MLVPPLTVAFRNEIPSHTGTDTEACDVAAWDRQRRLLRNHAKGAYEDEQYASYGAEEDTGSSGRGHVESVKRALGGWRSEERLAGW